MLKCVSKMYVSKTVSKMYVSKMVSKSYLLLQYVHFKIKKKNSWCRQNWLLSIEMFAFTALFIGSATKPVRLFLKL